MDLKTFVYNKQKLSTNLCAYEKNKKHIYAYREKNPEKIREISRRSMRKLRERKRELEKIEKTFLNILLEEKLKENKN